jgi:P-type conjugative transfer protein TrbL
MRLFLYRSYNLFWVAPLFSIVLVFVITSPALADAGVIQELQNKFRIQTQAWFAPIQDIATRLLIGLATISWAWSAAQLVLKNADFQEFITELVRLVMFVGFFLALILNADIWSEALIEGFMWAGNQTAGAGINREIHPAGILERGLMVAGLIIEAGGAIGFIVYGIFALVALILYAIIAAYALMVMGELYIVTAAGIILLGFGGSQWTADYAKRYITYCVSVGVKLYVLFLIVGLGEQLIYNWALEQEKSQASVVLSIIGALMILVLLVYHLPSVIQSVINGASIGSATPNIVGIATAAGGAVAAAASGGIGSAMAIREASKLAGEQLGATSASNSYATSGTSSPATNSFLGVSYGTGTGSGTNSGTLPMPGNSVAKTGSSSSSGSFAHAGQTMKNLGKAATSSLGNRMMGNRSAGNFAGEMVQSLRSQRLAMGAEQQHTQNRQTQTLASSTPLQATTSSLTGSISPVTPRPSTIHTDTQQPPSQELQDHNTMEKTTPNKINEDNAYHSPATGI